MSTGNNIETEYLELNEKQEWTVHYQVLHSIFSPFTPSLCNVSTKRASFELKGQRS